MNGAPWIDCHGLLVVLYVCRHLLCRGVGVVQRLELGSAYAGSLRLILCCVNVPQEPVQILLYMPCSTELGKGRPPAQWEQLRWASSLLLCGSRLINGLCVRYEWFRLQLLQLSTDRVQSSI